MNLRCDLVVGDPFVSQSFRGGNSSVIITIEELPKKVFHLSRYCKSYDNQFVHAEVVETYLNPILAIVQSCIHQELSTCRARFEFRP